MLILMMTSLTIVMMIMVMFDENDGDILMMMMTRIQKYFIMKRAFVMILNEMVSLRDSAPHRSKAE